MAILALKMSEIQQAYHRAFDLLQKDCKQVNNRVGWHQYLGENRVGDVATAQGILLMQCMSYSSPQLPELIRTLRESQHADGGWTFSTSRNVPTVEATVWVMLGLLSSGMAKEDPVLLRGRDWLIGNQNGDGGWGPKSSLESRVYVTFLACRCLAHFESQTSQRVLVPYLRNALNWLLEARNKKDGGWGEHSSRNIECESTIVHTAYALLTLKTLDKSLEDEEIRQGIRFLYRHWDEQVMWQGAKTIEHYDLPRQGSQTIPRVTIEYFPTAWTIIALLSVGESALRKEIFISVRWLLKQQKEDGCWPLDSIQPDRLWAIHDAVLALSTFISHLISSQTADRLVLLDDVLLISSSAHKGSFLRQMVLTALPLLAIGVIAGFLLSTLIVSHNTALISWLGKYWSWLLLCAVVIGVVPSVKLRLLSTRDAIFAIIIPILLIILQIFLPISH
jgi:Squalene-hopene cyclase C-terminal domain/Squalene-hopene cyclase N-terminal domain